MDVQQIAVALSCLVLAFVLGCGSSNSAVNNPPATPAPSPTPTTTPGPTPTPGPSPAPPPTPKAEFGQYEAALIRPLDGLLPTSAGQITVSANGSNGAGHVQAAGQFKFSLVTYTVTFCPFTAGPHSCFNVGTVNADNSGNIDAAFTFAQKGTWAGIFRVAAIDSMGNADDTMFSGVDNNSQLIFNSPLQPAGLVTPPIQNGVELGTDAVTLGFLIAGNGHLHAELHGAAPNATYSIVACGVNGSSSCQTVSQPGTLSTDGAGNGSLDQGFLTTGDPAVVFELFRNNQLEFATGFTVQ